MALKDEVSTLLQRAQRACLDVATVRSELAITRAESQRLLMAARQAESTASRTADTAATLPMVEEPPAEEDLHVLAMEVLHVMRELLSEFPVEWQVSIVKVITARTMLMVAAQLQKKPITLSA
jgi:hypothetical protein